MESGRSQIFNLETATVLRRICVDFTLVVRPKTFHNQLIVDAFLRMLTAAEANILLSVILQTVIAQTDRKIAERAFPGLLGSWCDPSTVITFRDVCFNIILSSYRPNYIRVPNIIFRLLNSTSHSCEKLSMWDQNPPDARTCSSDSK